MEIKLLRNFNKNIIISKCLIFQILRKFLCFIQIIKLDESCIRILDEIGNLNIPINHLAKC